MKSKSLDNSLYVHVYVRVCIFVLKGGIDCQEILPTYFATEAGSAVLSED